MKKQEKKAYGELENVLLTDEEYGKLKQRFPDDFMDRINAVGLYIESVGKKYKSHYATILNWDRRDKEKAAQEVVQKRNKFCNFTERGNSEIAKAAQERERKQRLELLNKLKNKTVDSSCNTRKTYAAGVCGK